MVRSALLIEQRAPTFGIGFYEGALIGEGIAYAVVERGKCVAPLEPIARRGEQLWRGFITSAAKKVPIENVKRVTGQRVAASCWITSRP